MRTVAASMLACLAFGSLLPDEKMLFVFEVVRHGARAPIIDIPWTLDEFKVGEGQLTAEGMRQRYLLGR
jgi:lysosomal acid phosphatase